MQKLIATNRKAYHDYFIHDTIEAGLVLRGSEIKSIRAGRVNLRDSYVSIIDDEAWLLNMHIAAYKQAGPDSHNPRRKRKLLLHRKQINRLHSKMLEKGYTIVPLRLYLKENRAKAEIALVRGKKQYDKRATIARKDAQRAIDRALKDRR